MADVAVASQRAYPGAVDNILLLVTRLVSDSSEYVESDGILYRVSSNKDLYSMHRIIYTIWNRNYYGYANIGAVEPFHSAPSRTRQMYCTRRKQVASPYLNHHSKKLPNLNISKLAATSSASE